MTAQLKLIALDADDLAVISAHVQDARVQTADIIWRQGEKRLVVGMSRLDWEQTLSGQTAPRRLIAALRFDRVLSCKSRNIDMGTPEPRWNWSESSFTPATPRRQRGAAVQPWRGAAARRRMPGMRADRPRRRRSRDQRVWTRGPNRRGWGRDSSLSDIELSFRGDAEHEPRKIARDSGSGPYGPSRNDGIILESAEG